MTARRGTRALIAGAGIGGLAAALALRQAGVEVLVFEQARELREIGAGLTLWPNAGRWRPTSSWWASMPATMSATS